MNQAAKVQSEILQLIEENRRASESDPSCEDFFRAESAFYNKNYENALKHYLKATSILYFNFFCYRASAYLFHRMNNLEKALGFAQKALRIYPNDYLTLALLEQLYIQNNQQEEAFEIEKRIKRLREELSEIQIAKTSREPPMNTESDIFSSPKSQNSEAIQALTQRLYPSNPDLESHDPYANKALDESESTSRFMAGEMGLDHTTGQALEQRIKSFQLAQAEITRNYLEQNKIRTQQSDFCLYYLNGWPYSKRLVTPYTQSLYLTEQARKATGGLFVRWNGKGIAINPGSRFLINFHEQGLHIRDIDFVIVTGDQPECYADVKEIYDLNYQLNKMSPELQIIHYYFSHKAFQELSRFLKPHFKQERNSLHSLELFVDSSDVEKIELAEGISLHYFLAATREAFSTAHESKEERAAKNHSGLGIRFELKNISEKRSVRLGYIANAAWNPLMAHHLGSCDLLITGFGNTCPNDYNKLSYNSDCLGYYGTYTLLEEVAPRLLLCGEFGGREGDIRLETVQKLRQEYTTHLGKTSRPLPNILPADTGLLIHLKTLEIKCSVNEEWINPAEVKAIKTADAFGKLEFLSPSCCY